MEENPVTQKPNEKTVKQRRLSSILKAPRIPLQDLGNDCKQDFFPDVPRKRSRRVSFALPIKVHDSPLSASEDGQIDGAGKTSDLSKATFDAESTANTRCQIAGMDTLLHAPIQTQPQQDQYEESNETLGNRTILFSGEDNDLTLSDTLLSVNISEKSQIDMKTSKIDFTSFLASLSSEKKSQSKEVFTSGTQSTSTNTTFFNDPSKDSSNFGNKISVNQFLASLKSTARPTHAVLESEEKENLGESALRLHGGKSKVSSVTSYSPVFPLIQESLHICKDKDQALDLTECHIANSETFICTDDLTKPLQGMISSQKMKMDISKSKPATNRKFESKFNCPQILSMHSLQGGNSGFDFGNKTVYCDDMDLTNSHTVCIERANVSINQNPQGLPLMNRERAPTATFCPGENTMIFHESEQNLDITNSLTSWIGSNNPTGSSVSESTSQAARKDLSFAPEKTVHFLGDDMDVTRSHTVAFEMQKHELAFGDRETYRSSPSCISTVNHNLNGNSDCVRLNMTQNIASETAPVRPSSDEPLLLHMFEKKAVGLPCEDICVTENNTNLTLRLASELNLDSTLENTSCSLRLQNNTDVTKVFINENCELDLTHSHTTNMQTVLPAVMAIGSKSFEFCNTTSVVGDESTRVVNNLPNAQISKNHQVLGSTKDRKVDDIPVCYSSDISKEIHTGQPTDTKVTLVPSRFGIGEETVRIEESMDVTKTHSVLIGCDALEPENSSTGLDSESEDMDITKSHTVAIDGNVIESQMNKRTFQSMTSTERCTEETVQKNMTEVELMQASNVSQTNNVHCPRPGRSLVMHLSKNQTIDFLDEEMDHTDVVTSKSQNDLLSKTATGPKLRLPFKCQPDSPVGFTEDMELTKSHTYCFDQNIGKPAKELIPTIEKPVDDNSQTVPRHFDSFAEKLKLDNSTVSKKYNPKQILGLSLSMKSSVFEQEKMAIHPNQSSQAIGKSELHNINAQQSCAYPQDDACNKTQLFRGTDDSLDITQCHTTNIERWTPVDERINSEKSMAESNWLIVNEANTDVTHHDKVHVQGACEQNTCRISSVKSGIQHAGSEIGCQWSSGITVDERDGISVDTTNMHKQNELKTSAVLPGNPVAQYPGNGFQSREASAFFISDDMEITRNNTVAISNRPPKSTGCYSQEASGMHTSRLSMADHSMDLTKCHTVVIEKQNIGMSTPTNQPSLFLSNSKKRIANLKGEFSDDSKEYVTENQSHGKSVLYHLPNDKTLLLSEDMNMTNYCDPETDASEKGRSVLLERSVLYSKGQQEMEMTASNTIFIDQNISMSEHLGTNLQKLCTPFPSNTSEPVNHGCASASASVFPSPFKDNQATTNNRLEHPGFSKSSHSPHMTPLKMRYEGEISMPELVMDITKCHTVAIEQINAQRMHQPLATNESLQDPEDMAMDMDITKCHTIAIQKVDAQGILYNSGTEGMLADEELEITKNCSNDICVGNLRKSGCPPSIEVSSTKYTPEKCIHYSKDELMDVTRCHTMCIDQETNREPQGNAQQAFTSFRNNCANNPNRNLVTDEAVLNVTATQMEMDYNNIELFQQREQTGSDLVSVGVNCMSLQLMDHSPIASHAKQNKESGRISMGNTTLPVERDMTQPGETECDRLIGCILNTSGILNRESSGKTKIDTNKADDGSLNQNCNSEIPVSQLPARISAEESSLHAFPDRMGKDKSRRASLADIQSKIERLKRQSEGEATCHTSPVSHVTEQRPTSFPPVTNDHRRLETLDVEISGPEKHQLTNYSEEQEMILAKAGNSTTTVNTARGDTIRNETCTLKMLTLGFILPRLPNKRKSIASNAEDIDKPASVMAVSEMNTSSAKMPKSLPVATSLNAFETSTSCSIFEESPSFLEEGEPNSSLNDDVPKGACEELCEKEARPGLADGGLLANKPCGSQKRTLELPADEYQEEKKCRNAFEWLCESAGKQENQTFMNLVSNQTAETYQTNSTLSRSLLKNSSSSNTSSVDSRGDGTTRELSQQCSRTDSRFLLDSDEFNLHKRLQEGVITVKEFFMLINLSALIQKPRFSELPENNEGHAHLTPEEIMHDRYIHHPKLQIYEEDCQALCQIIDELKCSVCVQDKPLAKVNPSLWEVMVTCTESELKLFGEKMRTIKSSYTLKSKVLAHKAKVKRYGQLLETSRNRYEELQSTIDDVDRLLQETDQCISALFHEAAQLEESTRDKCDSEAKGLQAELESLKSTEDEHKSDILNLERQKQAILTQISALQKETSQMDKRLSDYNFTEWKLSRWDDNSALFTFLYGSLELSITFGEPVDGVLFFGKPCRKISRVDFEFLLADEAPPSSLLCQRLILQFIGKKGSLPENNKTMLALPEFLFNISLVVTRCRHLAEEVEFLMKWHGKFNILKMEVHNSEVKMLFCSSVAFAKFEVIFSLSDNYPSSPLSFSVLKLIGRLGQGDISAVVSNVPPGPNYLKRAVQRIQRDLFL